LYRLAAEQGLAHAQSNLGIQYYTGEGVPQNNVRAYVWWSVAAAQGHETARTNRDIMYEKLTPDQLARGQDMATRCFESDFQDCD
jgi:TPR repeat protein